MTNASNNRFDALSQSYDQPHAVLRAEAVAAAIREHVGLRPGMDVMDFGAGTGLVALALRTCVRSITAADSSQGMLDILNEKIKTQGIDNITPLLVHETAKSPIGAGFDLVYSVMTMHHILDVAGLLRVFHRMLRPGGVVAIADLDAEDGSFHPDKTGVEHFGFDREHMKQLLEEAGFQVTGVTTAHRASKEVEGGETKDFSVFLCVATKV